MRRYALLIGNSEYSDPSLRQLALPEADVKAFEAVLRNPQIGEFDQVDCLLNEQWYIVQREIHIFFNNRNRDDFLLLFFAGHGVKDKSGRKFYLTFTNTERELLSSTAISDHFILEQMDYSRAQQQLLILDCCNSGAFGGSRGSLGESTGLRDTFDAVLKDERNAGKFILTATDAVQYAWEKNELIGDAKNSVFTHFLIQGLRTGAADGAPGNEPDGIITVDEIYKYVYDQVTGITSHQEPQLMTPRAHRHGKVRVAYNSEYIPPPRHEMPPDILDAVNTLPDPPREGLCNTDSIFRLYAIAAAQRILSHPEFGLATRKVLEYVAENDRAQNVKEQARQALRDFDKRLAEEKEREERIRQEIKEQFGEQATAFKQWVDSLYNEAQSLFESGDWNEAENALGRLEEVYPDDSRIIDLQQDIQEAREAEATEQARLERIDTLVVQAKEAYQEGDWDKAEIALQEAHELGEDDPRISELWRQIQAAREAEVSEQARLEQIDMLIAQAKEAYQADNWDKAKAALQEAHELGEDDPRISELWRQIQAAREAEVSEQARLEQIDMLIAQAEEAYQADNWDVAETALQEAHELGIDDLHISELSEKIQDARAQAAKQEKQRRSAGGYVGYARRLLDAGHYDSAEAKINEALDLIPDYAKALELLDEVNQARKAARERPQPIPTIRKPDVPEMVLIPAGPFLMGSTRGGLFKKGDNLRFDTEPKQFKLNLDYDYAIGKYPITVGEYRHFIDAGGYREQSYWTQTGRKWRGSRTHPEYWTDKKWTGDDLLPVVGVSWYEVYAYTQWLREATGRDYRLLTEAEWEKAARGGLQIPDGKGGMKRNPHPARIWPWGDEEPMKELCNFERNVGQTNSVKSHAAQAKAQPYGLYHMAGNVWEWCLSAWANPYQHPEQNGPDGNSPRVVRGGSWSSLGRRVRCSFRLRHDPHWGRSVGFRVGGVVSVLP